MKTANCAITPRWRMSSALYSRSGPTLRVEASGTEGRAVRRCCASGQNSCSGCESVRASRGCLAAVDLWIRSKRILELVAEKTGYPQDMLDLDLDLEADWRRYRQAGGDVCRHP